MKPLIKWPEREELKKTMPLEFVQHFPRCVCIIDCFEVFCQRPTDLMARAQTYSHYNSHNTVKFLIGIAPQGVISFLSHAWGGGGASDRHITESCDLPKHLIPSNVNLADHVFTVENRVSMYGGNL